MRKIILSLACISALCFGEDDPKCYEVDRIMDDLYGKWKTESDKRYIVASAALFESGRIFTNCECEEKIYCGKVNFCASFKCPGEEETVSIFGDIQNFAAKVGSRGSNSGSAGQP